MTLAAAELDTPDSAAADALDPAAGLDLRDAAVVESLFTRAARANLADRKRRGATVHLARRGCVVMSGDLHDHTANLLRLIKLADLGHSSYHHLVLHEVIHGEDLVRGRDLSVQTLARVAALKLRFPTQVHLMLGNHELAQLIREDIYKGDVAVVDAYHEGVSHLFDDNAHDVRKAMRAFFDSLLLAVRCANGVFFSHSLPDADRLASFDPDVIHRRPSAADLVVEGDAYNMVWGRDHPQSLADELARAWDAKLFVMGHQQAPEGYYVQGDTMLVLASDHDAGAALPVRLSRSYEMKDLVDAIAPLAKVAIE